MPARRGRAGRYRARMARIAVTLAFAVAGVCAAAAPVSAATVSAGQTTFSYAADPGEANRVTFEFSSEGGTDFVRVVDRGAVIVPTGTCASAGPNEARCRLPGLGSCFLTDCRGTIGLGEGDDGAELIGGLPPWSIYVTGGDGNDRLVGVRSADGGPGEDTLLGTSGNDHLVGSSGADLIDGRDGRDATSYGDRRGGVRVTLDRQPNDGAPGEGDDVRVEEVGATRARDVLRGSGGPDGLDGGGGGDHVDGRGGDDELSATGGATVEGGPGDDTISTLDRQNGRPDRVRCGDGSDTTFANAVDRVRVDCERVYFTHHALPTFTVTGDRRVPARGRSIALPVSADRSNRQSVGRLALRALRRDVRGTLGRALLPAIEPGATATVRVRLTATARRALRRYGRLRARVEILGRDDEGNASLARRVVLLAR